MNWTLLSKKIPKTLDALEKVLLQNRKIELSEKKLFFSPKIPNELTFDEHKIKAEDLKKAQLLIYQAISENKKIVIFGDYDADGICASAILWQTIYYLYSKKNPAGTQTPIPFIPHREKHGYGLSLLAIEEIIANHSPDLIVTVDNGIVAHEAAEYLHKKSIQLIITDHHQPETKNNKTVYPVADCIVHSTQLCGASVAWILALELEKKVAQKSLDLTGIATIADQVPLQGANRSFAYHGLKALQNSQRLGLIELFELMKISQKEITEWSVGFGIAPRINAMGRLEHGLDALRLLCTTNKKQARSLAAKLSQTNTLRQDITQEMKENALEQAQEQTDQKILIVHSSEYLEGVIGLIAGELLQKYHKPVIAISEGSKISKASVRSVPGFNIVKFLRKIQDKLLSVGGHPMAAGFSFESENLDEIKGLLFDLASQDISEDLLEKELSLDCQLHHELISVETVNTIDRFAPFGMKNPQPVFQINDLVLLSKNELGKSGKHYKLLVAHKDDLANSFEVLVWNKPYLIADLNQKDALNIAVSLKINEWNGRKKIQLTLLDSQKRKE